VYTNISHLVPDVPGAKLLREAVDVLGGEAVEQRGLAGAVLADEAVTVAALEAHVGFAEQHAAGEGEDDVLRSGEGGCQGFASVY